MNRRWLILMGTFGATFACSEGTIFRNPAKEDSEEQAVCIPQCDGKTCGPDDCDGYCGPFPSGVCPVGFICGAGLCVCDPQCSGKVCGADSCGGLCSPGCTGAGETCNAQGQCVPAASAGLSNCSNQGLTVLPAGGISAIWTQPGSWHSSQNGNFGDNTVWLFAITPPPGTGAGTFGRFTVSEYTGLPTFRELTISKTPCDFRARDYTGANGPLAVSHGSTAELYYGIGIVQSAGNIAYMTAGVTYYVNARNWQVDPSPSWSCGLATCNAIMNDQPATP